MSRLQRLDPVAIGVVGVALHLLVSYGYYGPSLGTLLLGSYPLVRVLPLVFPWRGGAPGLLVGAGNGYLVGPFLYGATPYGLISGLLAGEVLALGLDRGASPLRRALEWWLGFIPGGLASVLPPLWKG